ncbi:HYR domain-containing protein [Streptomyces filamentosus]
MRWFQSSWRTEPPAPRRPGRRTSARASLALLLLVAGAVPASTSASARPIPDEGPVTPASVSQALDPGASIAVDKQVLTPVVPPMPEVVLLVDGTRSMEQVIDNVRGGLRSIIEKVRSSQPDARFAVATFGDQQVDPGAGFDVTAGLTQDYDQIETGVGKLGIGRGNGSMGPSEDWINGLWQIADGAGGRTVFRENSSPVVVLVSDASSHNPSNGHSIEDTIFALQDKNARVLGIDVDTSIGDGLDGTGYAGNPSQIENPRTTPGQATRIIEATGGRKLSGIDPDRVAEAIVEGLGNLPTRVGHRPESCDPGLTVTLDPPVRDVVSGETAAFAETIAVAPDAPQGATLTCTVEFLLGTRPPDAATITAAAAADPAYVQQISITVNDVTAPVVTVDDRTSRATGSDGTRIDFAATAVDAEDGPLPVTCVPASGSVFPVGTTTVTCTATDGAGNTATATAAFRVLPLMRPPGGGTPPPPPPPSLADVAVAVSLSPERAYAGRAVVARYTLTNAGPDAAEHVAVDTAWPAGAGRALSRTDRCTAAAPCSIPPGGRVVVTQTATYAEAAAGTVRATVRDRLPDPEPGDNTATAALRVLQPRLEVTPRIVRPGEPVTVRGTDFPPGERVRLVWSAGLTADAPPLTADRDGRFETQVLVLRKDRTGPRLLRAEAVRLERLEQPVLVVRHSLQPPDFAGRG